MADPDELRVGIVGGTRLPGNVATFLENVRELLAVHPTTFHCDLLLRGDLAGPDGFAVVDPGLSETERAAETLRTLTRVVTNYASRTDVDVLFQVTKFPLHGCATTIAGRRTGTPVLTRFAGDNFNEHHLSSGLDRVKTFGLNNVLGRVPVHFADRIIVLGPHGRAEIEGRNAGARIDRIPQPVDRDRFSPVSDERAAELAIELGFPTDERILLSVGRLTERKGVHDLARAAEVLAKRDAPIRWYVLGEGPLRDRLDAIPTVEAVGRVPSDEIPDFYRAADLLVHPSLIEGLPNVLLEAAACGLPSLARDVGDSRLVASDVFTDPTTLPNRVGDEYEPSTLGRRFDRDRLAEAYANVLLETAGQNGEN